jgi:2-oxoglutarate dehydrogenase E2 component (dihydrolipoamide succinyltransferase)
MDVLMPQLGETVTEGKVSAWFKVPGDAIAKGERLLEVETDKVAMEVQALEAGVLGEIRVQVGDTVPVGTVLATITSASGQMPSKGAVVPDKTSAPRSENGRTWTFGPFSEVNTPTQDYGRARAHGGMRFTPLARRLIAINSLNTDEVAARARAQGRDKVGRDDVMAVLTAAKETMPARAEPAPLRPGSARDAPGAAVTRLEQSVPARPNADAGDVVPLNRIRRATARNLTRAWQTTPHVLQAVEIAFDEIARVRAERKEKFQAANGVALTYLPFVARAVCLAISAFPHVNAKLDGDHLVISRDVHLGIAVDLNHQGLVVPVVRHADLMNVTGLAKAIDRQIEKARSGRLTPDDLDGATYSISNNGSFGTLFTAPIINPPQVAILSTDAVRKRAVVVETEFGDAVVPRLVGIVAQCFDHRAFDGAYSAAYLQQLKTIIETRDWAAELG